MGDIRSHRRTADDYAKAFADLEPPLSRKAAIVEASRCLFCYDAPCVEACPTSIDIPRFIRGIQTDNVRGAAMTILDANILGGTCARVCPTEILCEGSCVRLDQDHEPVMIGALQRYATDYLFERGEQPFTRAPATGRKVAVVGAGPAGLACAHHLARLGHDVVIFEKKPKGGGLNEYGIATYKMTNDFAQREVDFLLSLGGIEIRHGVVLGMDVHVADLAEQYDAVFLGIGMGGTNALRIEGEELDGVMNAVVFIESLRQAADKGELPIGRDVVVIGGGNTAIDMATQAKRLGAENVTIVYRRGVEHMGATGYEQEVAQTNGVKIQLWAAPVRILGDGGRVAGIEFEYTRLDERGTLALTGERFVLPADQVFKAVGQNLVAADLNGSAERLAMAGSKIAVDTDRRTSMPRVWAGGDATGLDQDLTVVAVEDGKIAARSIHSFLAGN
ncbi:MAG TPA: NAD(P)-dependent oxidoreductase [Geminicoccus sp.]|jgi:glutamate synthase (NADPH/NADH) small chain|uniref:NAD(P)-dependent oxidoreductase n=1 Tax=Geminicoccus sp. TaxID=2024832 RepID=UPI002E331D30|nr:NAD(P)-dependent oxidoreductase [Geminicoccus sp.]HEX2528632.1 NAD(P)-dependent oxidoreductase [Geminicoccus sp.]